MKSPWVRSLCASALLALVAGCGGAKTMLFGNSSPAKNPFAPSPLLADNRSGLRKGYDRIKQAMGLGTSDGQAKKPEHNDAIALNRPSRPGPGFWVALAHVTQRSGNHRGAMAQYQRALEKDPNHLGALLGLARCHDGLGELDQAAGAYREATRRHPKNATAHNDLALCLMRQANANHQAELANQAVESLNRAVALQPKKGLYRNNISMMLVSIGREQEALQHLAAVHPPAVAEYNLGFLLKQQRRYPAARRHFAQALEQDPTLVAARHWLHQLEGSAAPVVASASGGVGTPPTVRRELAAPRNGNHNFKTNQRVQRVN